MDARAKLLGHPIHQMLIVFPLGLLGSSILFDLAYLITGEGKWAEMAMWIIALGIVTGLVAAVFGTIDWLAIPKGTRAHAVGLWHGLGNVGVVVLFAIGWALRWADPHDPGPIALGLSWLAIALSLVTGWLGGELVGRLGVGVHEGAHLDAPNSLSGRPARDSA